MRKEKLPFKFRMRLMRGDVVAIGPGKIELLEAIARKGSITFAARELGMSYRRAWLLIDEMNRCLKSPAVETAQGGKRGGGANVSALGRDIVRRYRAIERKAANAAIDDIRALSSLLSKN